MRKKGGIFYLLDFSAILFLIGGGFFYCPAAAAGSAVVINEIAWMGTTVSANDEWIEIVNLSADSVDLSGWKLIAVDGVPSVNLTGFIPANGYYLLERTDDETVPGIAADLVMAGALGNNGETLELLDGSGLVIDRVDMAGGWVAGDNATKATMERTVTGAWQTSNAPGGTPKRENSTSPQPSPSEGEGACGDGKVDNGEDCDDGNHTAGDGCSSACRRETASPIAPAPATSASNASVYRLGDVVINEFCPDPADGEEEWVELYNATNREIGLTDWAIEEGSGAKTVLAGTLGLSGIARYFIAAKPKGNLNNSGDVIILRDGKGDLIDQVAYGNWAGGSNNAPATGDPGTVARKIDGNNSFNNANDFAATLEPTKGESNIIKAPSEAGEEEEISSAAKAGYDYSEDVLISEIFPNPAGEDGVGEFIELYNRGTRAVDLTGWRLGDESAKRFEVKSKLEVRSEKSEVRSGVEDGVDSVIKAGEYKVFYREETKIALNNDQDSVKLYQPFEDKPYLTVKYNKVIEGWSYVNTRMATDDKQIATGTTRMATDKWVWTETVTPGEKNVIKAVNHPPAVEFDVPGEILIGVPALFDSSDTIDEDGDELIYLWEFGDGATNTLAMPEHTYFKTGAFTAKLTVSDGENKISKEKIVKAVTMPGGATAGSYRPSPAVAGSGLQDDKIIINEILPNPEGSDADGEFIELYNPDSEAVNLIYWQVDDSAGGSRPYTFNIDTWLSGNDFLVLERNESNLALNNTSETVRLFDPAGILKDEIGYPTAPEGEAYARGGNGRWFWTTAITLGGENKIALAAVAKGSTAKAKTVKNIKAAVALPLNKIYDCDLGDRVIATGTVAVLPGILGAQFFYMVGAGGVQVYNYKKDFPALKVGDVIEVAGEISETQGERRIKTKSKADIALLKHGAAPLPREMAGGEVTDECAGELIKVAGEIVDRQGATLFLDDGSEEVRAYIKAATGISAATYKPGDQTAITGLVGRTQSGLRLLPRSPDDITGVKVAGADNIPLFSGETATSGEWAIAARDRKLEIFKYLLILAGGAIIVLAGLLWQARKRDKK
jgi:cysteine-rich repeat protein